MRESNIQSEWEGWPANLLLFAVLGFAVLLYALTLDRTFLIDQQNYLSNFIQAPTLSWASGFLEGGGSFLRDAVIGLFSEEFLWNVWTAIFGSLFDPATAVLILVGTLNGLVILAARKLPNPTLAVMLWIVVPVGFADVGLLQLRQGFAFAVMLFIAMQYRRPALATFIAAMLHTTFAVAFVFGFIAWIFRKRPAIALIAAFIVAFTGAYAGRVLFDMFGGRRLLEYSALDGATSLNYVFGGLISITPSLYWILSSRAEEINLPLERLFSGLAIIHIGSAAFTLFCVFLFPLGAGRVGYLTELMLIPMLPALSLRRQRGPAIAVISFAAVYLLYVIGESYVTGAYQVLQ